MSYYYVFPNTANEYLPQIPKKDREKFNHTNIITITEEIGEQTVEFLIERIHQVTFRERQIYYVYPNTYIPYRGEIPSTITVDDQGHIKFKKPNMPDSQEIQLEQITGTVFHKRKKNYSYIFSGTSIQYPLEIPENISCLTANGKTYIMFLPNITLEDNDPDSIYNIINSSVYVKLEQIRKTTLSERQPKYIGKNNNPYLCKIPLTALIAVAERESCDIEFTNNSANTRKVTDVTRRIPAKFSIYSRNAGAQQNIIASEGMQQRDEELPNKRLKKNSRDEFFGMRETESSKKQKSNSNETVCNVR